MNLIFRLLWVIATARRRGRMDVLAEGRFALRCWPNDLDSNLHMNNGRYLTIMDLGRLDLILRSGLWRVMRTRKWYPVIGSARITFRRSIEPFQRFELVTRVIGWDDKWLYIEHRMERGGKVMAQAFVRGLFIGPDGKIPMAELVAAAGHDGAPTAPDPDVVAALA